MLLLKLLLVLILVHQDEVDPPHAVVEEQGVLLVVELGLWAKTRLTGELCCLIFIDLFLHNVIHGEQRERERERERRDCVQMGLCRETVVLGTNSQQPI